MDDELCIWVIGACLLALMVGSPWTQALVVAAAYGEYKLTKPHSMRN